MSARAPAAIYSLWYAVLKATPRAQLGGIVGDTAHSFGYHLARNDLSSSDYSVQLRADKLGASDCASALDVSLPPDLMKTCTARLLAAAKAGDPRLRALREFCGTLNGTQTYPWDLSTNSSEGVDTWDSSHLWHIHLSFYREFADDAAALAPIADVLAGHPLEDTLSAAEVAEINAHTDKQFAHYFIGLDGKPHVDETVVAEAVANSPVIKALAARLEAIAKKVGA